MVDGMKKLTEMFSQNNAEFLELKAKLAALDKSQAVIEFETDGTIITANDNFLAAVGYRLDQIRGQHHRMFVDPEYANSQAYRQFWDDLAHGTYKSDEFKRFGSNKNEIWIQASYNPIRNDKGEVYKVVKFATDITAEKLKAVESAKLANLTNAMQTCQACVMLADNDLNIVYLNDQVKHMLQNREHQLRQALPGFSVANLLGANVDVFHANPSHQRQMLSQLNTVFKSDIEVAELTFGLIATPWMDVDGNRLGTLVEWEDKTERLAKEREEHKVAAENLRIKQALDRVATNTMIADADFNIIYMNDAIHSMMNNAEADLRKDLPGFNAQQLLGQNIDSFHKNPSHQRSLVGKMSSRYETEIKVGGRTFGLTANPIVDEQQQRIGTVVEWVDRTDEVSIENEIDALVDAAGRGDFSRNIDLTGKTGFFRTLSEGLNNLMQTTEVGVNDVIRMLGALAKGNLTEKITREYDGAFGQLKDDANGTAEKLTEIIGNIRYSAAAITTASNEIAQGNSDLSQRTEEQASSLEETASSMEEMTSAVRQSSENARHANELAVEAQNKAAQGGDVVTRAINAMEDINASSKSIADIIGVIDEIAFQTNLLALNAAVEAARAGEQGRGFAVVAGEVRNLAQRSAAAAKEIKDLIRDSVTKVEDGTQLVNESGKTLSEIVDAVETVSNMMRDIANAAQEQTAGIEQVNTAIAQMDEMTQQNAALVEEASAASEAMSGQASSMNQMMDFFSLDSARANTAGSFDNNSVVSLPQRSNYTVSQAATAPAAAVSSGAKGVSHDDEWEEF